jgi:copper chaperone CopZ
MPEVHFYVHKPPEKDVSDLEEVEENLRRLSHVLEVEADPLVNVVAVTFEGGRPEQEEIERAIEEAGYEVSRLSIRTDFPTE